MNELKDMARDEICRDCKMLGTCDKGNEPSGCQELIEVKLRVMEAENG